MKMKTRPDDANTLQMSDWLAELREDGWAEPPADGRAEVSRGGSYSQAHAETAPPAAPAIPAEAVVPAYRPVPVHRAMPAYRAVPAAAVFFAPPVVSAAVPQGQAEAEVRARPADPTVRSVIGDQLRLPVMWCEMGSCVSQHSDPAALGEADVRARAIDAGWRIDAFGRLACPRCQQGDPAFRVSRPVVAWDRNTAMSRAARIVTGR